MQSTLVKRVLVLDAMQRSALAVTRSLGRQGVPLVTADESPHALAGCSKYSETYITYPSPKTHSSQFIQFLIDIIPKCKIDIILPMTELTTNLLLSNRKQLSSVILPFADMDTVNRLADKSQLMHMAEELKLPVPRTWYIETNQDLPLLLENLPYPLVLKPGKSWQQRGDNWARYGVQYAQNPSEVEMISKSYPAFNSHPYLLQECVSGTGQGIFALYDHGRPIIFFAHRRIREKPPSGGVSVLSESVPICPQMLAYAKKLLDEVSWHGVAMVEFKVDPETNTPYLMEVNTRFWGSLQLAIDSGVDFPWLIYQMACGRPLNVSGEYRIGVRSRWILGDLDSLYLTLRNPEIGLSPKLTAVAKFLTPHCIRTRHEINRWNDPGPFWYELKQYLHDLHH